jgi:hypothetical protein
MPTALPLTDSMLEELPELSVIVRDDGTVVRTTVDRDFPVKGLGPEIVGRSLLDVFPGAMANRLGTLVQNVMHTRGSVEQMLDAGAERYAVRVAPHGIGRAIIVLRPLTANLR